LGQNLRQAQCWRKNLRKLTLLFNKDKIGKSVKTTLPDIERYWMERWWLGPSGYAQRVMPDGLPKKAPNMAGRLLKPEMLQVLKPNSLGQPGLNCRRAVLCFPFLQSLVVAAFGFYDFAGVSFLKTLNVTLSPTLG
jgi:hypothetical protein